MVLGDAMLVGEEQLWTGCWQSGEQAIEYWTTGNCCVWAKGYDAGYGTEGW